MTTTFIEFRPNMRRLIEDAIESLILLLDEIDGDENLEEEPDLEDGRDAEPSLGATHALNQETAWKAAQAEIDLEFEGDGSAECDAEPSLGSANNHYNQRWWGDGARCDCEYDAAEDGIGDLDGVAEQIGNIFSMVVE